MVGILVSFSDGLCSGGILVWEGEHPGTPRRFSLAIIHQTLTFHGVFFKPNLAPMEFIAAFLVVRWLVVMDQIWNKEIDSNWKNWTQSQEEICSSFLEERLECDSIPLFHSQRNALRCEFQFFFTEECWAQVQEMVRCFTSKAHVYKKNL